MNLGLPELVLLVLVVGGVGIVATVLGVVKAAQNEDTAWIVGICVGWVVGIGWLVALIYLLAIAPSSAGPSARPPTPPYLPPPGTVGPPSGWHPDPVGRFELRYWDGTRWTEHVSTAGVPETDRL